MASFHGTPHVGFVVPKYSTGPDKRQAAGSGSGENNRFLQRLICCVRGAKDGGNRMARSPGNSGQKNARGDEGRRTATIDTRDDVIQPVRHLVPGRLQPHRPRNAAETDP